MPSRAREAAPNPLHPLSNLVQQVLFVYNAIDDFVMTNLGAYNKRPLKSAEAADVDLGKEGKPRDGAKDADGGAKGLSDAEVSAAASAPSAAAACLPTAAYYSSFLFNVVQM